MNSKCFIMNNVTKPGLLENETVPCSFSAIVRCCGEEQDQKSSVAAVYLLLSIICSATTGTHSLEGGNVFFRFTVSLAARGLLKSASRCRIRKHSKYPCNIN